ncbi:PAS domain-containing protein [Candidatus Obscuribacterales bacterium]|nr:PAS domain-containing protein [Candidatus Obscuribacterales bacterium]MBX3153310.1 PAS domain-containing protein [Candidatus Obscuribacterales bacterium]
MSKRDRYYNKGTDMINQDRITDDVLDNVPVICVLKDAYGAFVYWNEALNRAFELPADGMRGKTEYHFMPDDDAAAIRNNDRRVLATGEALSAIEFTQFADGTRAAWLVKKFRVVVNEQKFLGVIGCRVANYPADANTSENILAPHLELCTSRLAEVAKSIRPRDYLPPEL